MFELSIHRDFAAAHNLRGYAGNCERLHGHNWKVEIVIRSEALDSLGMVIDFREVKKVADAVLEEFDHHYLNELARFQKRNPTTENIASVIFSEIAQKLPRGVSLAKVTVWESEGCSATYSE